MAEPKKVKIVLNDIKKPLKTQRDLLKSGLKEHGPRLSLLHRLKYEKAILAMTLAHEVLKKIRCIPTDMSLQLPPSSHPYIRGRKGGKKR